MDNRSNSNAIINQLTRKTSKDNADLIVKMRPLTSNKPSLVQHLTRPNSMQLSSGFNLLSTKILSSDDPSYQPLVTISDNDNSDEDDFVSPIHKLTKTELREELQAFREVDETAKTSTNSALLVDDDDDDTGRIEFRTHRPIKRSICCYHYPFSSENNSCTIL